MRHFWGVLLAIVGSALLAIPSWVRAALSPSRQLWLDSHLALNVSTVRRAYLILIPVGLFWATFRAWKEENDGRIAAEKASPEALRNEIVALRADLEGQKRRILTTPQRDTIMAAFRADAKNHSEPLRFGIFHNMWNAEARDYAVQLAEVFSQLGASGVPGSTVDPYVPRDLTGLIIRVKDQAVPSTEARRLSRILTEADVESAFGTITGPQAAHVKDVDLQLVIGRRNANSA